MSYKSIEKITVVYNKNGDYMKLRLKDLREDHDLTQKQISEILMCDQSLYSKYERGEREIPLQLIAKLADYYEVSIDYIVYRTNRQKIIK